MAVRKYPCIADRTEYRSEYAATRTLGIRANAPRSRLRSLGFPRHILEHKPKENIKKLSFSCSVARVHHPPIGYATRKLGISRNDMKKRQFSRWSKQYRATETDEIPEMEYLIEWLEINMVADDGRTSLVHGDYRIDNIMFAHDTLRVVAVMDWELSMLGHPFADLAYQCVLWRWKSVSGLQGLGRVDLRSLGIPTEEQYVERYCQRAGLAGVPNWSFYIAFGAFRLAAIAQGIRKRALDRSASSERAMQAGTLARPMAVLGMGAIN